MEQEAITVSLYYFIHILQNVTILNVDRQGN